MFTLINSQKEMDEFCNNGNYHCVNNSWVLTEAVDELGYEFPVVLEDVGYNNFGRGFRIFSKDDLSRMKKLISSLENLFLEE